jgi:hypothetical protein
MEMAYLKFERLDRKAAVGIFWPVLVLAAIAGTVTLVFGADQPEPPPGVARCEAPSWETGELWKFVDAKGQHYQERNLGGSRADLRNFLFGFCPDAASRVFPLWVGKTVRGELMINYVDTGRRMRRPGSCEYRVVELKDVNVRAGTFRAYKMAIGLRTDILPRQGTLLECDP